MSTASGRWSSPETLRVRAAVARELRDLPPGSLVLVACSGGPDSVALTAATATVAPSADLRVGAVVVDHGLRDESGVESRTAAELLRSWRLDPVVVERVEVSGRGDGPEAAARTARYDALERVADRTGASAILLGHTLDDQAETVLMGLARGSGARTLAGMPRRRGLLRRPLLGLTRDEVRSTLDPAWPVADDPHNADDRFVRPRVRHTALPALTRALGPSIVAGLARSARLLRDDADLLDGLAAERYAELIADSGADAALLGGEPAAMRTRILRAMAIEAGVAAAALTYQHIRAVDALVTDWRGQGPVSLPGHIRATRSCGRLRIAPTSGSQEQHR